MAKRSDFLKGVSPDDPNYRAAKRFYVEGWADSNRTVAKVLAGTISFPEFVENCVHTFDQGARAHIDFHDETPVEERCREIDDLSKRFIAKFKRAMAHDANHLGKKTVDAGIDRLSRRVRGLAALAKGELLRRAKDRDPFQGDPAAVIFGYNPFPSDWEVHEAFDQAKWKAKERTASLLTEFLGAPHKSVGELLRAGVLFRTKCLSICFHEGTLIVGNEMSAEWYEQWLENRASFLLADTIRSVARKDPAADPTSPAPLSPEEIQSVEKRLTVELMAMVAHYKTVASSRMVEIIELRNRTLREGTLTANASENPLEASTLSPKPISGLSAQDSQKAVSKLSVVDDAIRQLESCPDKATNYAVTVPAELQDQIRAAIVAAGSMDAVAEVHPTFERLAHAIEEAPNVNTTSSSSGTVPTEASVQGMTQNSLLAMAPVPPQMSTRRTPRRRPDLEISRARLEFCQTVAMELATIKEDLGPHSTAKSLKRKRPNLKIWKLLGKDEVQELVDGTPFKPKAYAERLTLRKFGITSRDTLKKDRRKVRQLRSSER